MRRAFARHTLTVKADTRDVLVCHMSRGTSNRSLDLVFTAKGIALFGELRIGPLFMGMTTTRGTGAEWFTSASKERLCLSFLGPDPDAWGARDAGWLCAVRERFRELWRERKQPDPVTPAAPAPP